MLLMDRLSQQEQDHYLRVCLRLQIKGSACIVCCLEYNSRTNGEFSMSNPNYAGASALQDFRRARARAAMSELIARVTGKPSTLLSYDDVKQKLKAQVSGRRELRD